MTADWQKEAFYLCSSIAPMDLCGLGIYILDFASVRGVEGFDKPAAGCTSAVFDLLLQPLLESRGLWRGRGFCCLVNPKVFDHLNHAGKRRELLGIVLHELSHFLTFPASLTDPREDPAPVLGLRLLRFDPNGVDPFAVKELPKSYPWSGHGLDFIRISLHLASRARDRGFDICDDITRADYYRLSSTSTYRAILNDEIHQRRSEPIQRILNSHPPPEFVLQFGRDVMNHKKRRNDAPGN